MGLDILKWPTCRCTAKRDNLDGGGGRRCREHTEVLAEAFGLGDLWQDYGIVGDVVVGVFSLYFEAISYLCFYSL